MSDGFDELMASQRRGATARPAAVRQRQPTEIRRLLIVDAAREVISERGVFMTTMRDIAQAAGVSLGTVTYHFTGIAEILRGVLDREIAVFYEPVIVKAREAGRASEALQLIVDGFFADDDRTRQHWRLWLDFWSVSAHDERHAGWQAAAYAQWRDDVADLFARACEQGELAAADLDDAVWTFLALYDGCAVQAYLPRSPLGPDDARQKLTDWLRKVLIP